MPTLFAELYDGEDEEELYEKEDFEKMDEIDEIDIDADEDEVFCPQCESLIEDGVQCSICGWVMEIIKPLQEID